MDRERKLAGLTDVSTHELLVLFLNICLILSSQSYEIEIFNEMLAGPRCNNSWRTEAIVLVICTRQADAPISSCGDVKSDTFFEGKKRVRLERRRITSHLLFRSLIEPKSLISFPLWCLLSVWKLGFISLRHETNMNLFLSLLFICHGFINTFSLRMADQMVKPALTATPPPAGVEELRRLLELKKANSVGISLSLSLSLHGAKTLWSVRLLIVFHAWCIHIQLSMGVFWYEIHKVDNSHLTRRDS